MNIEIKEKLADYAHKSWSGWMQYLFSLSKKNRDGSITIPVELVNRWKRQINTKYKKLSEKEKDSDRLEADRIIKIVKEFDKLIN